MYTIIAPGSSAFGSAWVYFHDTTAGAVADPDRGFSLRPAVWLAGAKYENGTLIRICIVAYGAIALFAVQLDQILGVLVPGGVRGHVPGRYPGTVPGLFCKNIPAEKSGEYFGLYDIFGKGAAFMGTTLVGFGAQLTGSLNIGVSVIFVLFVIGFLLFEKAVRA